MNIEQRRLKAWIGFRDKRELNACYFVGQDDKLWGVNLANVSFAAGWRAALKDARRAKRSRGANGSR